MHFLHTFKGYHSALNDKNFKTGWIRGNVLSHEFSSEINSSTNPVGVTAFTRIDVEWHN